VISASILGPLVLICAWLGGWPLAIMLLIGFAGVVWEWATMCRRSPLPLVLGVLYAAAALAALGAVSNIFGARGVFFILIVVWCSDIGAYVAGRLIGGRRLAPAISPGKTWSGAGGGLVAAIAGGIVIAGVSVWAGLGAAILGVASQLGDLGESAVKRHYNVKDSGRLIPGHGGMLDRLDGLMAASLVAGLALAVYAATGALRP
jgi:phosphatidate cytidylyltransferase